MSFYWPWFLLLIPWVLIAPFIRRRIHLSIPSLGPQSARMLKRPFLTLISPALLALIGVCLTLALSRPQVPKTATWTDKPGLDFVIAMDTSGSMGASDYQIGGRTMTRLEASKAIVKRFVDRRSGDRIGVTVFGEEAFSHAPISMDHEGLASFVDQISIGLAGEKTTAIGEGMAVAAQQLQTLDSKEKILIILTDGENNIGIAPSMVAKACLELGIRIYAIQLVDSAVGFKENTESNALREIVQATGGNSFFAQDAAALQRVYSEIDELEPTTATSIVWDVSTERFELFLFIALFLLLVNFILSETWLRRLT